MPRWLTVASPEVTDVDLELALEPNEKSRRQGVSGGDVGAGHPLAAFEVTGYRGGVRAAEGAGCGVFTTEPPTEDGSGHDRGVFADTCGNLIQSTSRRSPTIGIILTFGRGVRLQPDG